MTLLGQTFQALGGSHKVDRPLIPEESDAEPAFVPYAIAQSDPPPVPDKMQSVLGIREVVGSNRLGGYMKR